MRRLTFSLVAGAAAILAGCGGGGSSGPVLDTSLARGSLAANPPNLVPIPQTDGTAVAKLEPTVFGQMLEAATPGITQVTGTPKCAISTYYMKYGTVGGAGETTDATGAIMVPSGSDPACSGPRPVVLYAHGTTVDKSFNMANLRDNQEAALVAAMYAAQGFIVVAPNYAGYDVSSLGYHPYLNAEQQADDMVDAMRAARKAFSSIGAQDSGKLLISGYSQGGYVAMAAERAMQTTYASEFTVTALAGLSGPYAISLLTDAAVGGSPNLGATVFFPMLTTSWQKEFGDVYSSPSEVYEDQYVAGIETLLPGSLSMSQLFSTGKLPQLALFAADSLPQNPGFESFFGSGNLVKTSYRDTYLADIMAHPCNADPANPLNCSPTNGFRKAAVKNDLRTYVPTVPVFLCGGEHDPTVFFQSTTATQAYFLDNGMPPALLTVLDVDSPVAGDPYDSARVGFATAAAAANAAAGGGANGNAAVTAAYHGSLVPPFCNAAARGFFQAVLGL